MYPKKENLEINSLIALRTISVKQHNNAKCMWVMHKEEDHDEEKFNKKKATTLTMISLKAKKSAKI